MASHIGRRKFLAMLGGAAAAWPLTARAQQPMKLPTIGFLASAAPATQGQWVAAFVQRLRDLGWIEGHNLAIEYRWAEGRSERFAEMAAEFSGRARRQAGDIRHPHRVRGSVGPGRHRPGRESGATGRQRHRSGESDL